MIKLNKNYNFINIKNNRRRMIITITIVVLLLLTSILPLLYFTRPTSGRILLSNTINFGNQATIWTTDIYGNPKTDFAPGEIVYIHGSDFLSNHIVDIDITKPDSSVDSGSTMTDSAGIFVYEYDLDGIIGTYDVLASDGTNSAQTTFTDINVNLECQNYGYDYGIAKFQCGETTPEEWGDCTGYTISVTWSGAPDCSSVSWTSSPAVCGVISKEATNHYDNPGGTSGTITKHGTQAISHITFCCCELETGCLEVTKVVDWGGSTPDPGQTFTVTVTGPSHPSPGISHVFGSSGGSWTLSDLIPGVYTVVETDPGQSWDVTPGLTQTVTVDPGTPCASVSITNTLYPGCLEIDKYVDWAGHTPDTGQTFTVTVTGPSHPSPGISHVFGSSGGWWKLYDLIPGVYTVTETDPGSPWIVSPGLTQTVTVEPVSMCEYVSITNFYYAGCLEITKNVEWWGVTPDPAQTFTVTVTGPSHPSPGISHVFGSSGGTWTLSDLTPGVYTVTETDPGPNWIVTPSLTQTASVSVGTPCASVSITNIFDAGCLNIEKYVEWGSVTPDTGQTFTVTVTGPSHPSPGTTHVFNYWGGMWKLYDLIPGVYTVTEIDPGSPWVVTPGLTQTVTVYPGFSCAYVCITNTYSVGCLEVTKVVDWVGATPDPAQTFTVTVTGPSHPSPGITHVFTQHGGTWTLNDLIPGVYTVTETYPGSLWTVSPGLTQTVTVDPATSCASVSITNTYNAGCLEVTKVVDWGGVTPDPGQTFTVTVTGPSHPSPGISHVFGSSGGTWTLNDLVPGSYSVVESDPGSSWVVTPGLSQTVTVDLGTPCATVSITNTLDLGCLEVTKVVDWLGSTPDPGQTFTVTVTGPSYPSPGITHVFGSSGGTWTLSDLIPGVYTVVETDPGSLWIVTPSLTQTVTVDPGTPCATVGITNTYDAGCLEITKTVDWGGMMPDPGQTFTVTVTGPSHPSPGISHVFGPLGGTWTLHDLIPGSYTVTETDPGLNWVVTPGLSQTVTVDPGTSCTSVEIINTANFPCIDVVKKVWNETSGNWEDDVKVLKGQNVLFKITIFNCGNIDLTNIVVTDTMADPQLEYNNNAIPPEDSVSGDLRTVIWNIPILAAGDIFVITFHAKAVQMCYGWNNVCVTTDQEVGGGDYVSVKVEDHGTPIIDINKVVWNKYSTSWVERISRTVGTVLTFKNIVTCNALSPVHDVTVTDTLPDHLIYLETITPGVTIVSADPHEVIWDLGDMNPGDSREIEYKVKIDKGGLDDNVATVTTAELYTDADSVLVKGINPDPPTVVLIYPQGGETLKGTVTVEWYAHDSQDGDDLPIYLYYFTDNNYYQINDKLENTGEYEWDTTTLPDGTYTLLVEAVDSDGNIGHDESEPFQINNHEEPPENQAPNKPNKPSGPASGKAGDEYSYTSSTSDPDGDQVWYMWDWGDGTDSGWIGPYNSGEICEADHIWDEKDDYNIRVKAKDEHGKESAWSDPLGVSMPRNKQISNPIFQQILKLLIERFPVFARLLSMFPIFS